MPPLLFGLFEMIGEALDPGDQGSLAVTSPELRWRPGVWVVLHTAVALMVLGTFGFFLVVWTWPAWGWTVGWSIGLVLYLLMAHYFVPTPDMGNLGWFGGILDNPFRWSDDWNRLLIFLWIVLIPGRFVTIGLRDGLIWFLGDYPEEPRRRRKKRRVRE